MRRAILAMLLAGPACAGTMVVGGNSASIDSAISGTPITPSLITTSTGIFSEGAIDNSSMFPYSPLQIFGNANTYLQEVIQNTSNGTNASGDIVLVNDLGGDTSFYLDIGANSSKFSQVGQTIEAASSTFITSSDSDLIIWAGTNGGLNGAATERIVIGSSNPVTANASVLISSVGMVVGSLTQIGAPLDVVSTTQGLGWPVLTTAQVQASTPKKAGQAIYNSTLNLPCISTGTTVQGYSRFTGVTTCQ